MRERFRSAGRRRGGAVQREAVQSCSAKTGASTTLRAACVTRKSRGHGLTRKKKRRFLSMSEVFSSQQLEPVESVWQAQSGAESAQQRTIKANRNCTQMPERNKPLRILCERILTGKPVGERVRESLQLSSFSPSSSLAVDLHTLVEKSHGSELFLNISSEILLLSIRCSLQTRRYIVTWVFHMFSLQLEHMMYPRCIKI